MDVAELFAQALKKTLVLLRFPQKQLLLVYLSIGVSLEHVVLLKHLNSHSLFRHIAHVWLLLDKSSSIHDIVTAILLILHFVSAMA